MIGGTGASARTAFTAGRFARSAAKFSDVIALEARGKGLLGITLRYLYEARAEADYFDDIPDEEIPKDMLELASHIVETKSGHFDPDKFEDALKDLLKKKQEGKPIERPERPKTTTLSI